jgi:hypothetical protein
LILDYYWINPKEFNGMKNCNNLGNGIAFGFGLEKIKN